MDDSGHRLQTMESIKSLLKRALKRLRRVDAKWRWIVTLGTAASLCATWVGSQGWGVAMGFLAAWLASSGATAWASTVLFGLGAWALVYIGQFFRARTLIARSSGLQVKPVAEPSPPLVYKPDYTTDEIKSEILPALTAMAGILERRCKRAIAPWENLHSMYWQDRGALNRLRGDEATNVADELRQSRELVIKAHNELDEVVAGTYERELFPLVDISGSDLREICCYLEDLVARLVEFSKPTAEQVDRAPVFSNDAQGLRKITQIYNAWFQNACLLVGNRNYALRQVLEERAARSC
jgi:hypothetical protein